MSSLRLGPRFTVPVKVVTETLAILAVKRAGKSNTAVVMAEAMYDAGLPWVAVDPKGDWWGIRAAGDGKAAGLEVIVFGGEHGDVPLEPTAGRLIADLVVDNRLTCVLDVSEMSKADMRRFLLDFAERLYKRNREPLHVFCEEADEYIPQRVTSENTKLVGAFETLVKRGGFRGIGVTLITQRSASLNKDVLTQVGTLIAMRTPSPQDRKAVFAWIDYHDTGREIVDELPTLENGTAWVISPEFLQDIKKVDFRRRRTFDSGATPEVGKKVRPPARLADVDLDAIKNAMAETIEKQMANDPKVLQRQIAALKHSLEQANAKIRQWEEHMCPVIERPIETEVPVLFDAHIASLEDAVQAITAAVEKAHQLKQPVVVAQQKPDLTKKFVPPPRPVVPARPREAVAGSGEAKLGKAERAVLTVLAQHDGRRRQQLTSQTGYSYSGGFRNTLAALRTAGFIVGGNNETMTITDAGLEALGEYEELPTGAALLQHWLGRLSKAEALALTTLIDIYPARLTGAEMAQKCGYEYSGGFRNALSRLRTLELIEGTNGGGMTVDADFMEAIR